VSTPDQLRVAAISGVARRYSARGQITADQRTQAVAELRQVAAGRSDLLAQCAGIELGFADNGLSSMADQTRLFADLCIQAGADTTLIQRWRLVGRKRADDARQIPYTGNGSGR
jgi:hypothetical protein